MKNERLMNTMLCDHMADYLLLHLSFSAILCTVIFHVKTYYNMTGHEKIFILHIEVV